VACGSRASDQLRAPSYVGQHAAAGPAGSVHARTDGTSSHEAVSARLHRSGRAKCSAYSMEYMMARVHSCHDMSCLRACVRACERTWSRSNIRTCVSSRPHREVERPGKPSKDIGKKRAYFKLRSRKDLAD
jgi:hypothetical protein